LSLLPPPPSSECRLHYHHHQHHHHRHHRCRRRRAPGIERESRGAACRRAGTDHINARRRRARSVCVMLCDRACCP